MPEFKITLKTTEVTWTVVTAESVEEAEYLADIDARWTGDRSVYEWTTEEL